MKIEVGKKYKDGWGVVYEVVGPTKENPEWARTTQGYWFRFSDGRHVTRDGPHQPATDYDLREEASA